MTEGKVKTVLGKVALTPCGEYEENRVYRALDVILYKGNSFLVLTSFEGMVPDEANPHVVLLAQKGDPGEAFTYDDFTMEQLAALRGEQGKGFCILGTYETLLELEAMVTGPEAGDAYAVGLEYPYDVYIYDAVQERWTNHGPLEGPQGEPGTDGRSAYEIAVEYGFEGTEREWLLQQVINGENLGEVHVQAPAITLEGEGPISLRTAGKALYNEEELAVKSDLAHFVTHESLQEKINQLGAITYIALITEDYTEVEALENLRPGAIALVKEETPAESNNYKEYIWLSKEEGWEFLGMVNTFDVEKYYTKEEVDEKFADKVDLASDQTICGKKTFLAVIYGKSSIYTGGKTLWNEGVGSYIGSDGTIHLNHTSGGNINFHYANNSQTTSKIIESASGRLDLIAPEGVYYNGQPTSVSLGAVELKKGSGREAITTEEFIQLLKDKGGFASRWTYLKGSWSYANNDYIIDTNCGTIALAGAIIEIFTAYVNSSNTVDYSIRVTTANAQYTGDPEYSGKRKAVFIYNNQGDSYEKGWWRVPQLQETPQYGTYQQLESVSEGITFKGLHDIRYISNVSFSIPSFNSGSEGMEYIFSVHNNGTSTISVGLPSGTNYQLDSTSWTIPAGKVGQLSIRYIFGKYILKVL